MDQTGILAIVIVIVIIIRNASMLTPTFLRRHSYLVWNRNNNEGVGKTDDEESAVQNQLMPSIHIHMHNIDSGIL